MKLRITSDWQLEHLVNKFHKLPRLIDKILLPPLPDDHKTVLIIAGDLGELKYPKILRRAIDHLADRFFFILWVVGNHEYYGGDLRDGVVEVHELVKHHRNVIVDNFEKIPFNMLGDKRMNDIWLCTLWTDFRNGNPQLMLRASDKMNDYCKIRGLFDGECPFTGHLQRERLTPETVLTVHNFMRNELLKGVAPGDVIVSHHAPSFQSISEKYRTDPDNAFYASNMDHLIEQLNPALWIHGHVDEPVDYTIGNCRVIANPRGAEGYHSKKYNPALVIEV